ncbi:thermonuclease family protein [Aerosakkonema sp. BLCC-F183]|uniref:thermonuclease family protein n=1 Tax=Aerosakkonema sp. BLCC-F183 TaxID=3342834 RepID=UPI0035B8DB42
MEKIKARINYISDGDTINFTNLGNGESFNSRARWIDCPEIKHANQSSDDEKVLLHWEWGKRSKEFLSSLIPLGFILIIYNYGQDQYGRTISDWYLGSSAAKNNIQYQLIANGLAVPFLPFDRYDWPITRELTLYKGIIDGTAKAYKGNLGFWPDYKSGKFLLPREFKKFTI